MISGKINNICQARKYAKQQLSSEEFKALLQNEKRGRFTG